MPIRWFWTTPKKRATYTVNNTKKERKDVKQQPKSSDEKKVTKKLSEMTSHDQDSMQDESNQSDPSTLKDSSTSVNI